ncbi:hypothetical protein EYF80_023634 [Liparis tanakae]|uniref:Uncharacterized protein n=1 Tax=Liparis tanakae TaxID=230148 RepID=A0A4Z2HK65_9TELE|nr:hypothetical protein EYF80_023634 [Liparis tanakae]
MTQRTASSHLEDNNLLPAASNGRVCNSTAINIVDEYKRNQLSAMTHPPRLSALTGARRLFVRERVGTVSRSVLVATSCGGEVCGA